MPNKFENIKITPQEIQKIREVNNYFKGIRMNTQYKKFYNEDSFDNIAKFNQHRKITDLPFKVSTAVSSDSAASNVVSSVAQEAP